MLNQAEMGKQSVFCTNWFQPYGNLLLIFI